MQSKAISVGKELVKAERALDQLFASRMVKAANLARSVAHVAKLQGELRQVHLEAHLEQTALLTPQQVKKYVKLRGYGTSSGHTGHRNRHH